MLDIHQIIPDPDELLALDVSQAAQVLLRHLDSYPDASSFGVRKSTFFGPRANPAFAYSRADSRAGKYTDKITELLKKAWEWLLNENYLVSLSGSTSSEPVRVSRKGREALKQWGFDRHRLNSFLRNSMLHPTIAKDALSAINDGRNDIAVFTVYRALENNVREVCGFEQEEIGVPLMRKTFNPNGGPLKDSRLVAGEQEAMANIFAGAIGSFKNPTSHRLNAFDCFEEAVALVLFGNYLLNQVDELALANGLNRRRTRRPRLRSKSPGRGGRMAHP
jgi:uncharacterized protein (TIGR02391 family)